MAGSTAYLQSRARSYKRSMCVQIAFLLSNNHGNVDKYFKNKYTLKNSHPSKACDKYSIRMSIKHKISIILQQATSI